MNNPKSPLNGVNCSVANCIHHSKSDKCTADCICVGCHSAEKVNETGCETFTKCDCCE